MLRTPPLLLPPHLLLVVPPLLPLLLLPQLLLPPLLLWGQRGTGQHPRSSPRGSSKSFFSSFSGSPATCNTPSHPRRCLASRQVRLGWQRGLSIPPRPHTLVPSIGYREPVASSSQHRTTHVTPFLLPRAGEARQAVHGPPSPVCPTSGLIRSQTPGSCMSPSLMGNSYLSPKPRREDEGGCWGSYCLLRGECIPLKVC